MAPAQLYNLPDRGVVSVSGPDALSWLDNLVSADLTLLESQPFVFSGLLSPQGKVLFEFFACKSSGGLLLETAHATLENFVKRLRLYKLRAKIDIADVSAAWTVAWSSGAPAEISGVLAGPDPRDLNRHMFRALVPRDAAANVPGDGSYLSERVRLGIAEAPHDYTLGDIFPHEANYDLDGGASFTKGCYVGQEVVSRMQNKTVVRKRVVRVSAAGAIASGSDVSVGTAVIGKVGSASGNAALALLRLDRVVEAFDAGTPVTVAGQHLDVDPEAIARYRRSVANRPVVDL